MTNKEMRERIESALATMRQAKRGGWLKPYMAAHKQLFDLCAALESEPEPLAVIKGWAAKFTMQRLEAGGGNELTFYRSLPAYGVLSPITLTVHGRNPDA